MALSFAFNPFSGNFDTISTVAIGSPANGLSITAAQVLTIGLSSTSTTGALSSTDWNTFNNKGSGSVTTVSVVTANGVSGSVATATTTPAITLTLGAITPSSVAAVGTVTGSNLSGTNTGDVTLTAVGAVPSANGASLSGQALTLQPFDGTHPGVVTASGGGSANFLRADGTWATPAGTGITQLTGDVTAGPGSGSVAATIANSAVTNAKMANMASTSTTAGTVKANMSGSSAAPSDVAMASANTASSAVFRDGSGNFSAGTITASLSGNATTATTATNATNVATTQVSTNASFFPLFVASSTNGNQAADLGTGLTFNPSTNNLTTTTFTGALTGTASGNATITPTNHGVVISGTGNAMTATAAGTSGQPLLSGGASADPAYGTLGAGFGGTGQTTYAVGDILYASASTTLSKLTVGSANQVLQVLGSNTSPTYNTINQSPAPNYITANPNAEVDTTGWATYADAAANVPVDGTGGSATNLTFSRSTSTPLRGTGSFSMAQANSTSLQGKGVSYDFTINSADQAKVLSVSFDYNASATFVASNGTTAPLNDGTTTTNAGNSDIEVFLYDVTNAILIPVSPQVITANGSNNFSFKGSFQTASNSTSYRLIFHIATTSANATGWTFKFDNVFVSPQAALLGPAVLDWNTNYTFTPASGAWGTISNAVWKSRRVGDSLEVQGTITTGTVASGTATLAMPAGLAIDSTKFSSASNINVVGMTICGTSVNQRIDTTHFQSYMFYDGSDTANLYFAVATNGAMVKDTGSDFSQSTQPMVFKFLIPIAGWSSTTTMSNDTDTRVVAARVSGNPASAGSGAPIIVPTVDYDTHAAYNASTGRYTAPVSGFYRITGYVNGAGSVLISGYVNAVSIITLGLTDSNGALTFNGTVKVNAGDLIDIRPGGTFDSSASTLLYIERLSGPATIAASESVNARYFASATAITGSLATISWTTKDFDSHSGMSAGTYTVPISGKYQVNSAVALSGTFALNNTSVIEIQKNGSVVSRVKNYAAAAVTQTPIEISDEIACVAGDTIRIQVSSGATLPTIVSSNFENYISLFRTGN